MMDFMKKLYTRLAPWYDEKAQSEKEETARKTIADARESMSDATVVLRSYKMYDRVVINHREKR